MALAQVPTLLLAGSQPSPLIGVFHASGVLSDATLPNLDLASIRAVLGAKTAPLERLSWLSDSSPCAMQVLFSSVAALLGSPGQANYAAANAALDSAAQGLAAAGLPSVSLQFGAWAGKMRYLVRIPGALHGLLYLEAAEGSKCYNS